MKTTMIDAQLSYCMNVHAIESWPELRACLNSDVAQVKARFSPHQTFPVGLWLSKQSAQQLRHQPEALSELKHILRQRDLSVMTVNAFPMGGFHNQRVKDKVYRPSWAEKQRLQYSQDVAFVLAELIPQGASASFSTLPLSFKAFGDELPLMTQHLVEMAMSLFEIEERQQRTLQIALEPEPFGVLETTDEVLAFFQTFLVDGPQYMDSLGFTRNRCQELLRRYVGVCFDTCHLACQWESLPESVAALKAAGIEIPKTQISVALELQEPSRHEQAWRQLRSFDEPRYLHQSIAQGGRLRAEDLPQLFEDDGQLKAEWQEVEGIRTHFHVPIFWRGQGPLATTRASLDGLIDDLYDAGCRQFEVETYSWNVIPEDTRRSLSSSIHDMLAKELDEAKNLSTEHFH